MASVDPCADRPGEGMPAGTPSSLASFAKASVTMHLETAMALFFHHEVGVWKKMKNLGLNYTSIYIPKVLAEKSNISKFIFPNL